MNTFRQLHFYGHVATVDNVSEFSRAKDAAESSGIRVARLL